MNPITKEINLKANVIARIEFELAFNDVTSSTLAIPPRTHPEFLSEYNLAEGYKQDVNYYAVEKEKIDFKTRRNPPERLILCHISLLME